VAQDGYAPVQALDAPDPLKESPPARVNVGKLRLEVTLEEFGEVGGGGARSSSAIAAAGPSAAAAAAAAGLGLATEAESFPATPDAAAAAYGDSLDDTMDTCAVVDEAMAAAVDAAIDGSLDASMDAAGGVRGSLDDHDDTDHAAEGSMPVQAGAAAAAAEEAAQVCRSPAPTAFRHLSSWRSLLRDRGMLWGQGYIPYAPKETLRN